MMHSDDRGNPVGGEMEESASGLLNGEKLMWHMGQIDDDLILEAEGPMPEKIGFLGWGDIGVGARSDADAQGVFARASRRLKMRRVRVAVLSLGTVAACAVLVFFLAQGGLFSGVSHDDADGATNWAGNASNGWYSAEVEAAAPGEAIGGGIGNYTSPEGGWGEPNIHVTRPPWSADDHPTMETSPDAAPLAPTWPSFERDTRLYHSSGLPMIPMAQSSFAMDGGSGMQMFSTTDISTIMGDLPDVEAMLAGGAILETLPVFQGMVARRGAVVSEVMIINAYDYPIITPTQARQKLLDGRYLFDVFVEEGTITEDVIVNIEIVYLHWQDVFMPFYVFKVELPVDENWREESQYDMYHGMWAYGWFYVPAVQEEFLQD